MEQCSQEKIKAETPRQSLSPATGDSRAASGVGVSRLYGFKTIMSVVRSSRARRAWNPVSRECPIRNVIVHCFPI